jgi:hypothetical protein
MNEFERRVKELTARLSQWWSSGAQSARQRRAARTEGLRREAASRARQAASRMQDFRESERGQRAASRLSDLRASEPAKRAEAMFNDLRASDAGKKAQSALADLRQREPVKKAEESTRKAVHDLFSGSPSGPGDTGAAGTGSPAS